MNSSDLAYKRLINDKIADLTKTIKNLERRRKWYIVGRPISLRIEQLKAEREQLQAEAKDFTHRENMGEEIESKMTSGNEAHAANDKKIADNDVFLESARARLKKLQAIPEKNRTKEEISAIKSVIKDIDDYERKNRKLGKKNERIEKKQGRYMHKFFVNKHHNSKVVSHANGRAVYFKNKLSGVEAKISRLSPHIIDQLLLKPYYSVIGKYYKFRKEHEDNCVTEIQNQPQGARLSGARVTKIKKWFKRNNQQQQPQPAPAR